MFHWKFHKFVIVFGGCSIVGNTVHPFFSVWFGSGINVNSIGAAHQSMQFCKIGVCG